MKISILLGCLLMLAGLLPADAADMSVWRHPAARTSAYVLRAPPRSVEAQAVWASDACWRGCEQQCGWRFQACLAVDGQGACTARTDACDRSCQSGCRTYGGPLLNFLN
jgi:hypothetical protein